MGASGTLSIFRRAFDSANMSGGASTSTSTSTSKTSSSSTAAPLQQQQQQQIQQVQQRPKHKWGRYEYDIKHHYGLQGRRVECEPFTCDTLAKMPPKVCMCVCTGGRSLFIVRESSILCAISCLHVLTKKTFFHPITTAIRPRRWGLSIRPPRPHHRARFCVGAFWPSATRH